MENVIEKLKEYSKQIDLEKRFSYTLNTSDSFFTVHETKKLNSYKNSYEQNIKLKWLLCDKYKQSVNQTSIDFWVINNWGGIKGFKPNERNIQKVEIFKKQIQSNKLTKDTFSTISSLSKLASFINPDEFVIYDSRVIYSLNWLILTLENKDALKEKYYPMPSGRNKKITDFDLNTIINLSHIKEYFEKDQLYIMPQDAYFKFCEFIKNTSKLIYGEDSKPYELELLLFTIADDEIYNDIKDNLKLSIKN